MPLRTKKCLAIHGLDSSWNDPGPLALKVSFTLIYLLGLIVFQHCTGLLYVKSPKLGPLVDQKHHQTSRNWWHHPSWKGHSRIVRSLLEAEPDNDDYDESDIEGNIEHNNNTINGTGADEQDPMFPPDLFTKEQIKSGAVIFYILGVLYMFVALAIVCDEFFVPALDVMIEILGISEDVAGATFMAAGGSAPELFTSMIGVFIAFSDVGIGTIVGSAVFNILFVIGMCALFSTSCLVLTWWPLLRDCTFYSTSLVTLVLFFTDQEIPWYESATLLGIYGSYVFFMKFNAQAEVAFKKLIGASKISPDKGVSLGRGQKATGHRHSVTRASLGSGGPGGGPDQSNGYTGVPILHSGAHFHHGLLTLMIHTIDPLDTSRVDEKAAQLHAIANLQNILHKSGGGPAPPANNSGSVPVPESQLDAFTNAEQLSQIGTPYGLSDKKAQIQDAEPIGLGPNPDDGPEPLSLAWPDTCSKRITYVCFLPLVLPLWLTLPDTRKQESRKFFPISFLGSILWIAVFSYLMVWWATISGEAFSIPPEVMGLTFLAAGTSIPDLFTSVIVARKGFGDMAVSSSVGSNIFDVTVGLPLPWFMYSLAFNKPVPVSSEGMICSIALLFIMLVLVFLAILMFGWKMTKGMGISMFVFYFVFVMVTLGMEYEYYDCPI